MSLKVKVEIDDAGKICKRIIDEPTGKFIAETWAKIFQKYTPKDTGMLSQQYTIEPFLITYNQRYSHYQWNGISKSGNPLNYSKEKNFLAQSHWEEAAFKDRKDEVARAITKYIGSK